VYNDDPTQGASEYLFAPLSQSLQKSTSYFVQFFVVPVYNSLNTCCWVYTDVIGLALTQEKIYLNYPAQLEILVEPAIENRGTLIKDTVNWTEVSGCYTAKGGEKYATIGNFRPDDEVLTEVANPNILPHGNYFFIEDVLVMPFDPLPDTLLLCGGAPQQFDATFLDASYQWSTGDNSPALQIDRQGLFWVAADMGNCVLRDTVLVIDTRDLDEFVADTLICSGSELSLTAPMPGEYQWSTGSTTQTIAVQSEGRYALSVTNECGEFLFETKVRTEKCDCNVFVPNVFSPEQGGVNSTLAIGFGCDFPYRPIRFQVFDRWGSLVFSTADPENSPWDGIYKGKALPAGVYVWTLVYEIEKDDKPEVVLKTGDITIIW
jgi:gliding motility-associated-like protein